MKKRKVFFLITTIFLILSCKQSILEVEKSEYKNEVIYCLVKEDITGLTKIKYAPFESLKNFQDLDITFNSQQIQMHHSNENNLLLVANEEDIYFIDSRTNKLIKKINIEIDISEDTITNRNERFYDYNNEYCFLIRGAILYKIYYKTMLTEKVFSFSAHLGWEIKSIELTHNGRYFYIMTQPKNSNSYFHFLHHELYKYDLIKNEYKHLFSLESGSDLAGVSKDYYLIKKYNASVNKYIIAEDKLIESYKINIPASYRNGVIGNNKNNTLYYINNDNDIFILNLNENTPKHYLTSLSLNNGSFIKTSKALYYFSFSKNNFKIINIDTKKIEYPNLQLAEFEIKQIVIKESKL